MLKQRSKLILAVMLLACVAFVSCNNGDSKKTETKTSDSTKTMDSTGVTKPLKTVP